VPVFLRAMGTKRQFSASTVDQMPKQVAVAMMYCNGFAIPVPDIDRTGFLLVLGANPLVSNGSLWTAPDLPGRIKALKERGGRLVIIDPVRTRTAQAANEHHFIRPGTDGLFLFGLVHTLFAEGLVNSGRLAEHIAGLEEVEALARAFSHDRLQPVHPLDPSGGCRTAGGMS
jgi:anaerobic selenocysteine-containing dehydrogenase